MHRHEQAVNVEDRQGVDQHIVGAPVPVAQQGACVAQQVAVRQHGAFAAARGARGVQDGRQIVGLAACVLVLIRLHRGMGQEAAVLLVAQGEQVFNLAVRSQGTTQS